MPGLKAHSAESFKAPPIFHAVAEAAEEKLIRGCPKASAYVREFYDDPDVAHFKTIRLAVASGELPCLSYAQGKGLLSSRYVFRASDLVSWAKTRFYS